LKKAELKQGLDLSEVWLRLSPGLQLLSRGVNCKKLTRIYVRIPCLVLALYTFVCSLDVLSMSFRLMAGRTAGI
jgi:hypothetical protein